MIHTHSSQRLSALADAVSMFSTFWDSSGKIRGILNDVPQSWISSSSTHWFVSTVGDEHKHTDHQLVGQVSCGTVGEQVDQFIISKLWQLGNCWGNWESKLLVSRINIIAGDVNIFWLAKNYWAHWIKHHQLFNSGGSSTANVEQGELWCCLDMSREGSDSDAQLRRFSARVVFARAAGRSAALHQQKCVARR